MTGLLHFISGLELTFRLEMCNKKLIDLSIAVHALVTVSHLILISPDNRLAVGSFYQDHVRCSSIGTAIVKRLLKVTCDRLIIKVKGTLIFRNSLRFDYHLLI